MASTSKLRKRLQIKQQLHSTKLTRYRKRHVEIIRIVVTENAETCRFLYKEDLMHNRDTQMVFKHLKNLNKLCSLPKLLVFKYKTSINVHDKVKMLNEFFQSFFSPKYSFDIKEIEPEISELTNFTIEKISLALGPKKLRVPDGFLPLFYQKTRKEIVKFSKKIVKT